SARANRRSSFPGRMPAQCNARRPGRYAVQVPLGMGRLGSRRAPRGALLVYGPDLLLPGHRPRAAPGLLRAVSDLEPRAQRGAAPRLRLEHPPERRLLPELPRRDPRGDRTGAARVLLEGLGEDREGSRTLAPRPLHRPRGLRREARLAAGGGDDPGRAARSDPRASAPRPLRLDADRRDL